MMKVTFEIVSQNALHMLVDSLASTLFCPEIFGLNNSDECTNCEACWFEALKNNAVTRRHRIEDFLCGVGIQPRLRGFTYLVDAIEYVMDYGDEAPSAMCTYDIVALKRDVPDYSVEKCMRYAIRKSSVKINSWAFIVDTAYRLTHSKEVNDNGK